MTDRKRPSKLGDYAVICDICGNQRYKSECKMTWDGFIACTVMNCWYPKDPLFMQPPIINDPYPLQLVRPDTNNPIIEDENDDGVLDYIENI